MPNKSLFASVFGLGLQRLGTFNTPDNLLIKLNMLPAYRTLLRNRQISVISRSLVKMWILIFMIMTLWTGGLVLPQYLESQVGSRGFESIAQDAQSTQAQLQSITTEVQSLDAELAALSTELQARGRVQFMDTLPDLVPDGVELDTLVVQSNTALTVTGSARSEEAIKLLESEIANSGLAANMVIETRPPNDEINYNTFTLTANITRED